MKTKAEIESLVRALDLRLADLPADMDRQSRREIYETEFDRILEGSEPAERWAIFCHLDAVAIRHGVANCLF